MEAMESGPPPAQGGGAFPSSRSPPSPSHPAAPDGGTAGCPSSTGGKDGDEGTRSKAMVEEDGCRDSPRSKISRKRKHKEYHMQVGEEELRGEKHIQAIVRNEPPRSKNIKSAKNKEYQMHVGEEELRGEKRIQEIDRNELPRSKNIKSAKNKGGLPVGSISASPRVTSSPGVNILVKAAALRRASMMVNSGSIKRAKTAGSPEGSTSQQSLDSPSQQPAISPSLDDLSPVGRTTNSQRWTRRPRKLLSRIWKEVEPIYEGRKLVKGRCVHCQKVFPASRDSGSSHIGQHLKVCPVKTAMNEMVGRMGHPDGIDPNWKFDPAVARRKLVKFIVVNEMAFSLVEYSSFREFTQSLNPWFENVSRTTIKNDCRTAFEMHGDEMKEYFEKECDSRVSLTGDMWTSNQKLGYLCMTCHFISEEWILHKRIIRFSMMETPHNSLNMFNVVLESIQEWNIEDKLFSFTLDNASVNTAMVNLLRDNLKDKGFLLSKGKLLHFRCATHVFNIIVQDGLREIKTVVHNIRESVKFIKSSQARVEKFLNIIIQVGLSSRYTSPSVDVTTRWNSTYLMLEAALPLRGAFSSLEKQDKDYEFAPLPAEWKLAEAICKLLKVFYTATVTLSGSNYPTAHLYFYQLWNIKKMLNKEELNQEMKVMNKEATSQDIIIARMIGNMQIKFNQYWKESYKSACIPVILDPRFKYDLLEYLLRDFGSEEEARTWMGAVKKTMEKLFNEYNVVVEEAEDEDVEDKDDPLAEWDKHMRFKRRQSSNELDRYLKEELVSRKEEVNILQWWKINSSKYPVLSKMARDILAIPASTVPSESAFSTGGRVVSDYRSSLSSSTVEILICLQDWFKAVDALRQLD